jgi:hypothetical protein
MAGNAELNNSPSRSAPQPIAALRAQMSGIAVRLEGAGVNAAAMLGAGLVAGIAASASIALHANFTALGLFVASRLSFILASHATHRSAAIAVLDSILARIALALMPFGFALADASHALAASFAMLGILVGRIATQTTAHVVYDGDTRLRVWGMEIFAPLASIALAAACIEPDWFGIAAYGIGILGFVVAGRAIGALVA